MTVYIEGQLAKGEKLVFTANEKYIGSHLAHIPLKECIKHDAFSNQIYTGTSDDIDKLLNKGIVRIRAVVYNTNLRLSTSTMEGLISADLYNSNDLTISYFDDVSTEEIIVRRVKFEGELDLNKLTVNNESVTKVLTDKLVGEYLQAEISII